MDMLTNIHSVPLYSVVSDNSEMCIKLVSIKELYYDARPTKSQDQKCMLCFLHLESGGLSNVVQKIFTNINEIFIS